MSQQQQQSQPQGNPFSEAAKGGLLLAASPLGTMMGGIALLLVVGLALWIAVAILTDTVTAIYNMRIRMELATISVVRCLSWLSIAMAMLVASIISGFMRMFHHTVIKAISERRFSTAQSVQLLTVDAMPIMFGILYSICRSCGVIRDKPSSRCPRSCEIREAAAQYPRLITNKSKHYV